MGPRSLRLLAQGSRVPRVAQTEPVLRAEGWLGFQSKSAAATALDPGFPTARQHLCQTRGP